jgi:sodium-dependent phosphate cotransporter
MSRVPTFARVLALLAFLYLFLVAIVLLAASFEFLGESFAGRLLSTTADPFVGLFIGILATSIVQSSSTVTAVTVSLVAGGGLDIDRAIPIVIGSNIGTSVTNTLVAAGQITRPGEFRRAFAAAVVDDCFEITVVLVLLPLQLATNFLGIASALLARNFEKIGGLDWMSPLEVIVGPAVRLIVLLTGESGSWMLVIALALLVVALTYLVANLKVLFVGRVETFLDRTLFKTASRALLVGLICTLLIQSSSVATSLVVPLAGIGVLTLQQVFPYALGANIGTTFTALLAALVTGEEAAVAVALSHLLYNVGGTVLIWPIRRIPLFLASTLARYSSRSALVPLAYVIVVFFAIPLAFIYFLG